MPIIKVPALRFKNFTTKLDSILALVPGEVDPNKVATKVVNNNPDSFAKKVAQRAKPNANA